jgi:hypothetical protein
VLTAAVLTAAVLTAAPDAGDAVVASDVWAAIGDSSGAVRTELAGCAGSELLTTGAVCADKPVAALGEVPRPAAASTDWRAASVGIDDVVGAVVAAGMELRAVASVVGDTCCGAAEPDSVEVLPDLVSVGDAAASPRVAEALSAPCPGVPLGAGGETVPGGCALPVPVGDASRVSPGVSVWVGVVLASPELLIDDDGPPGWIP